MSDRASAGGSEGEAVQVVGTPGQPVPRPSSQYRNISGGKVFLASVPSNWTSLPSKSAIKIVPENGYGPLDGQTVFTHGVEFGIARAASRDLRDATNAWLESVVQNNPKLSAGGAQQTMRLSQRAALATPLLNASPLGGQERIGLYTTFLADGTLFYYLTVAPDKDADALQEAFRRIGESIRLTDVR
jgi:hypothetical protein